MPNPVPYRWPSEEMRRRAGVGAPLTVQGIPGFGDATKKPHTGYSRPSSLLAVIVDLCCYVWFAAGFLSLCFDGTCACVSEGAVELEGWGSDEASLSKSLVVQYRVMWMGIGG